MIQTHAKLAIDGGAPIRKDPLPPWPHFEEDEVHAAAEAVRSGRVNYWTGNIGKTFEQEFSAYTDCKHAIAIANGTLTLELALQALGIGPGDEVIVPCRTFIASASSVVQRGAVPVIADVDLVHQNLSAETVSAKLSPRTKAIIAVHHAGWPCPMDEIMALAEEHKLYVIEDCAQAHGATYKGRPVGGIGHVGSWSFCQDKIMTLGGEGGMVTIQDDAIWEICWSLKDHGKNFQKVSQKPTKPGFRWLHDSFGSNYRLTEMQSAIGRRQLDKLPEWNRIRNRNAAMLGEGLSRFPCIQVPQPPKHIHHGYYKYYTLVDPAHLKDGWSRDRIMAAIMAEGIPCFSGTCIGIHKEKAFQRFPEIHESELPNGRYLGEQSLMFQVHPTMGEAEMKQILAAAGKVLSVACR